MDQDGNNNCEWDKPGLETQILPTPLCMKSLDMCVWIRTSFFLWDRILLCQKNVGIRLPMLARESPDLQHPQTLASKVSVYIGTTDLLFWGGVFNRVSLCCVALAVLYLTLWTKLALNSQRSDSICLPLAGIKRVLYHWPDQYLRFSRPFFPFLTFNPSSTSHYFQLSIILSLTLVWYGSSTLNKSRRVIRDILKVLWDPWRFHNNLHKRKGICG